MGLTSAVWCEIFTVDRDTNGDEWNYCDIHEEFVLGDAYVCEGYVPEPYSA